MSIDARRLAGLHAAYLLATGTWPLVHRRSFEAVTGRKEDFWLARTVGGLAIATGLSLGIAAGHGRRAPESRALAVSSAVAFAVADIRASRTESRSYLADIPLQIAFSVAWLWEWKDDVSTR